MDKAEIIEREVKHLDEIAEEFVSRVKRELKRLRKHDVELFLSQQDRYRLLKLKVWEEKYRVSLRYLIRTLVPYWELKVQRWSRRGSGTRKGLGVKVGTLVGQKSEEYLKLKLEEDFPDGQQFRMWRSTEQDRIIRDILRRDEKKESGIIDPSSKQKSLADFSQVEKYDRYYHRSVVRRRKQVAKIVKEMWKRPYRGCPFGEHLIR